MKKQITGLIVLSMLSCFACIVSAEDCPYDSDYKNVLKKALGDYLKNREGSKLQLSEIKKMLNFYLSTGSIVDSNCTPEINALIDKADNQIPYETLKNFRTYNCNECPDGALCGEQNDKGQTCTCKDVNSDGKSEFCFLKPMIPQRPTCNVCPDKTPCGDKNQKGQTCTCKDRNSDGKMEYCFLSPWVNPSGCLTHQQQDCTNTACCIGLECKMDYWQTPAKAYKRTCCQPDECAMDSTCKPNGATTSSGLTCQKGYWTNRTTITTTTVPAGGCLNREQQDCTNTQCCTGLECKMDYLQTIGKAYKRTCCQPDECAVNGTCKPNGATTSSGLTCQKGYWVNRTTTTTTTMNSSGCLTYQEQACANTACCTGLECKTDLAYPSGTTTARKICCKPDECAMNNTCRPNEFRTNAVICQNGEWNKLPPACEKHEAFDWIGNIKQVRMIGQRCVQGNYTEVLIEVRDGEHCGERIWTWRENAVPYKFGACFGAVFKTSSLTNNEYAGWQWYSIECPVCA